MTTSTPSCRSARRVAKTVEERFWPKVDRSAGKDACWPWTASVRNTQGRREHYGSFSINGRGAPAHRVAYELVCGPIPVDMFIAHSCDNPRCCNPDHLHLATHEENQREKSDRGRARGGVAGLTPDIVRALHLLSRGGYGTHRLGAMFGITASMVRHILHGRRWHAIYEEMHMPTLALV